MTSKLPLQENPPAGLAGSSEMAACIRNLAWSQTPLGPLETWPPSLRTVVDIMLGAIAPLAIYWGADHILLYNDTWKTLLGEKHPHALGQPAREVFAEVWTIISPMFARVMSGQGAVAGTNQPFPLARSGQIEEAWFDFSFNPITCEDGSIGGILNIAFETTDQMRVKNELEQTHRQLQSTIDSITDGLLVLDRDWRCTYFSETGARMIGMRREDLIGGCIWDLFPHARDTKFYECYQRAVATGQQVDFQEFYPEPLNKWIECHCYPTPEGLTVYFRDITERKRTEEALRVSEEHARRIIDNTLALVGIMTPDGTLIEANATALNAGGLRRDEVVGLKFWDCYWWNYDVEVQNQLREAVATAAAGHTVRYDVVVRTAHDSRMHLDFMLAPVRNNAGQVAYLIPSAVDISERKQAEEALKESESFYRQTLESIPGMVFTTRPDGYCDYQSRQWVDYTGIPMTEHLGDGWIQLLHPNDRARAKEAWQAAIEKNAPYDLEYRVRRHDGAYRWFKVIGRPIRDELGKIVRWFGVLANINDLKRTEKALQEAKAASEEANRAKSEFLANMSHEIRTPMTVFMAAIEHLLQIDHNAEHRQLLDMANQSAGRLRNLIDDVLDLSRIEAGRVDIEENPFDLRACVHAAIELFTLAAREKNLRLEMDVAREAPRLVAGDTDKIGQVLINLIGNAVKFTHQGVVRVSVRPRGKLLEFAVADTGIGIPEEKHDLLFQKFSQVDSSFTREVEGTGLGLAISKGLVELMGGAIAVQSRLSQGSVFTFTIPLKTMDESAPLLVSARSEDCHKRYSGIRVLLVEDEPMIRETIALMLSLRGLHPVAAETGRQAVEKCQEGVFDLIFMDLQMPEMNGLEATRAIRDTEPEGDKHTCIIGMTAHASREIKEQCLESGMDRVLTKPIKVQDLFSAVDVCL